MQAVFINKGDDRGVYFYGPSQPDANIGFNVGVGAVAGAIDFNEASGQQLNRRTFEGKSQGWSLGVGPTSSGTVTSYTDGKWSTPGDINKTPVLYSGKLGGFGAGGDFGIQYTFSQSKLIPSLSIPFKK
ncbi:MAG: hypothetical protein EOO42_07080 [Flavobacteriales bacterium]|nr:MAG: hypothetical protein EOO42_07080 [Flavobacteriales bacterium]